MVNLEPIKRRHFTRHVTCSWESVTGKVKELNTEVGFILELTVFTAGTTFIGMLRCLVLHGEAKITSQEVEGDLSQNTPAYTLAQSFRFLSSLQVIKSSHNI